MDFIIYFINANKFTKRLILTKIIICAYSILLFADGKLSLIIRKGFGYINFGYMFFIITSMIFIEDIVNLGYKMTGYIKIDLGDEKIIDTRDCIDGIPSEDLILFLLENKGLPTSSTKEVFYINNEQLKKLGDNLERVGILERGKNNARVLKIEDYDIIKSIIDDATDSNDLRPALLKIGQSTYEYMK